VLVRQIFLTFLDDRCIHRHWIIGEADAGKMDIWINQAWGKGLKL
jgi:hypothetical protein